MAPNDSHQMVTMMGGHNISLGKEHSLLVRKNGYFGEGIICRKHRRNETHVYAKKVKCFQGPTLVCMRQDWNTVDHLKRLTFPGQKGSYLVQAQENKWNWFKGKDSM